MKDRSGGIRRRGGLGFWLARRARARAAHVLGLGKTDYGRGDSAFIGAGRGADAQARGPRGSVGGGVRIGSGSRRKKATDGWGRPAACWASLRRPVAKRAREKEWAFRPETEKKSFFSLILYF